MAKKKQTTKNSIINYYMEYVLEHNKQPTSVYKFASENNFDEILFYEYFSGFEALEKHIFKVFFENTHKALSKSKDYDSFSPRNKLLSFYYTFFENLTANRSYVMYTLSKSKNELKNLTILSELKKGFGDYIDSLQIETIDIPQEKVVKLQEKSLRESAWIQFLMTLKFWMEDTSSMFEKTDIFIEKSVNTSFDLLDIKPFKSIIDFGKFLLKEKVNI
ncbi:TetR family transcriptional regulator C-terminal domain-containing protein [Urechidicola croceus]|uniref:Heat-shock protein n=1 Tax=Urechidicola croceus TaxID=1850246 RepID=A0A1D8P737_9FLAO|nr:TetR family transcriptional regulator C-terminal domain-containing protein [Urechidicola croceus]AOW20379.1 heat-shock protein [Urechidicola croceus]